MKKIFNPLTPPFDDVSNEISDITGLQTALDDKLDDSQLDTDPTLSNDSDSLIASQKATKSYVDTSQSYMVKNTTGSSGGGTLSLFSDITGLEIYDSGVGITTDVTMAMDSDYQVSTEHAVKTYVDTGLATKLSNVVEDTTPQLGGNLDLNNKAISVVATAGENLVAGNLCYLKSDGKYWKAGNGSVTTSSTKLLMANATINADATGEFIAYGQFTTSGLVAGSNYFVGTAGAITTTPPTTEDSVTRPIGTALSTTVLEFNPDVTWLTYKV